MTSENPSTQDSRDYLFSWSLSGDEKSKAQMTEELTRVVPGHGGLGIFSTSLRTKGDDGKVLLAIRQVKVTRSHQTRACFSPWIFRDLFQSCLIGHL